jgi:hypothetical protein
MAQKIIESRLIPFNLQSGDGSPSHISPAGTMYFDRIFGLTYQNLNGISTWGLLGGGGGGSTFTGGTVTGPTNFLNGLTTTTILTNSISATTYFGLPKDVFVTGGTYSSGTATFTNNTGGTFNVTGFSTGGSSFTGGTVAGPTIFTGGLSANTISATTYQNLPLDIHVTGGTFNAGTAVFTNNSGGTFSLTGFSTGSTSSIFTGGTVSGETNFTNGLSANTFSASTYFGLPKDVFVTGGTYSAGTAVFTNNTGGTFTVSGFSTGGTVSDTYVTGFTYNNSNTLTIKQNQGQSDLNVLFHTVTGLTTDYFDFNTGATVTPQTARLRWNDADGTLDLGLKGGNVTLQIGQEQVIRVVNKTGSNLLESNYQVVRVRTQAEGGAQGQRLAVLLAQANTKANHTGVLGLVTENINNNQEGFITTFGNVRGLNTTGSIQGETWSDGDVIWLSETVAGGLTNIEPSTHPVAIGYVVYAHVNNGKIFVKVEEGVDELNELHDVNVNGATNGQVLTYSAASQTWVPTTVSGGTGTVPSGATVGSFGVTIDGMGGVISLGQQGYVSIPYNATINGWTLLGDQVGSCVIDVWRDTFGNFPPTSGDTIAGSERPTLSSQSSNRNLALTGWTTNISIGDIIGFNVLSATGVTRANLIINVTKL